MRSLNFLAAISIVSLPCGVAVAAAAPQSTFDWNPRPVGLHGSKVYADGVSLSDYGQIMINPITGGFTESGYLAVTGFVAGGLAVPVPGFNDPSGSGWGVFFKYRASGTQAPSPTGVTASYSALTYTLTGFNGLATYGLNPLTGAAFESGGTDFVNLGTGSLIDGSLTLSPVAFSGATPTEFAASGKIDATLTAVPRQFSSFSFLDIALNVIHLPGEVFPISPTVFEADGGNSSFATFWVARGNSAHTLALASLSDIALPLLASVPPSGSSEGIAAIPEAGSVGLLAGGVFALASARRRRAAH